MTPLPVYGNGVHFNDLYNKEIIEESDILTGTDNEEWIDENNSADVVVNESEILSRGIYELEDNNKNEYDTEDRR